MNSPPVRQESWAPSHRRGGRDANSQHMRLCSTVNLVSSLPQEMSQGKARRIAVCSLRRDLAILDELSCQPFSQTGGALLSRLLSKLYKHTGVVITTSLHLSEWSCMFGVAKLTTALLARQTDHCYLVETGNESHRFMHSSAVAKKRITAREQMRRVNKQSPPEADK